MLLLSVISGSAGICEKLGCAGGAFSEYAVFLMIC